ncbi:unnamed protein product [Rotaria sordida]|uniref:Uncharacterized protein n=1 Tax=Rotaria sordida TaxID=392033 RepID=A0A818I9J1_9BILA|nr:unnamed protein product [Rotaria sordida]
MCDKNGQVVAGGHGQGNRLDQLNYPTNVLIDKETDSLIICDQGNRRVVQWSRRSGITQGEILIDNIHCHGLAMDDQRYLYISDYKKHAVRQYQIGDKNGTIVAGGNGEGAGLNQLNFPTYIFVDQQQTVYVLDCDNHRVMKWNKGAQEGIVVAGGQGKGNALTQLSYPEGLFVDTLDTIYVTDSGNHRVMRWPKGEKQGTVILGGNGKGEGSNQFDYPVVWRRPRLSTDEPSSLFTFNKPNDYYVQLKKNLLIIQQHTRDNIIHQQRQYKINYDKQRPDPYYEINDPVLIKIHGIKKKLEPTYSITPKIIIRKQHPIYWIKDEKTQVESRVHDNDIRSILILKLT